MTAGSRAPVARVVRVTLVGLLAAMAACGKEPAPAQGAGSASGAPTATGPDDCQRYLDKARPVIVEMTARAGQPFGAGEATVFLRECRASTHHEPLMACVIAAPDDAAVRACYTAKPPPS